MRRLLARLHTALLAWWVTYLRKREILRVFEVAHTAELRNVGLQYWPLVKRSQGEELRKVKLQLQQEITAVEYRQMQEVAAIRAGKMDVVDRKSWAWPFLPSSVQRLATPIQKATPYNLRRMSRTPVPRRAMNIIKGAIVSQPRAVEVIDGVESPDGPNGQKERIKIAEDLFNHPNNVDSFQSFAEMGTEDMLVGGAFASELRVTIDPKRPLKMWTVNIDSIRIFPSWSESTPDMPHYAQMTGLKGERGAVLFYDDELMYIKDNPSNDNPFGLGKMEVAFRSLNDFLGIQDMSGRAGSDQVHKTWLWWEQPQMESSYQIVRRHIQNELEGQAKVSLIGGMKKPDVLEITPVTEDDLLLNWQEMLIRMIANAFEMSAMALGVEHDVNRAVGQVLSDKDFRTAVVPIAMRLQEGFTRKILHDKLGWYDLRFKFLNLEDPDIETKMDLNARGYSTNARTPREIRKSMGWPERDNPFDDLSQFEAMMLNTEAQAQVQEAMQTRMMQKSSDMQNQQMDRQRQQMQEDQQNQQQQDPNQQQQPGAQKQLPPGSAGGKGGPVQLSQGGKNGQPPAPKPLSLPKFTIAGTKYSAEDVRMMPLNKLTDTFFDAGIPMKRFVKAMTDQEPGILDQMSDEAREFIEQTLVNEEKKKKNNVSPALVKQWAKEQMKRYRKDNSRIEDFGRWLQKYGSRMGKPGGGSTPSGLLDRKQKTPAGKPGQINPIQRN